ncbi:MAG TPA: site-specific integrase [Bryobacteraceae bacterium]|jgi:site-specific recombinase XerD|nr:site-specific integrase [Bryobacteraceae bacterium]
MSDTTLALQAVVAAHKQHPTATVTELAIAASVSKKEAARALSDAWNHPIDTTTGLAVYPVRKTELVQPFDLAQEYQRHSKSENTLRAYDTGWKDFCQWCESHSQQALPASPEAVSAYIADCASRLKVSSISQRLAAITEAHRAANLAPPTSASAVRNTLRGIKRELGTASVQKAPTLSADICQMLEKADAGLIGLRDRALILLGFSGAFRRSEVVGLDVSDLDFAKDGLKITLRRSKTDQTGEGRLVGIPFTANPQHCTIRTLQEYLTQAGITAGPVFRSVTRHGKAQASRLSGGDVALVVKKLCQRAGLDPAKYAGHSLRAGHVTSASVAGKSLNSIMNQTGHHSVAMVRKYIRAASLFVDNSASGLL